MDTYMSIHIHTQKKFLKNESKKSMKNWILECSMRYTASLITSEDAIFFFFFFLDKAKNFPAPGISTTQASDNYNLPHL